MELQMIGNGMRALLASLLAITLSLTPISASALTHQQVVDMSHWAGCRAEVVTSDEASATDSSFQVEESATIYFGTAKEEGMTDEMQTLILFHEVSHCLQYQEDYIFHMYQEDGQKAVELDADYRGVQLACAYHLNGRQLIDDVFSWMLQNFGYTGDWRHGSIWERMAQGDKADWCAVHNEA
jgi:hypothetical protein